MENNKELHEFVMSELEENINPNITTIAQVAIELSEPLTFAESAVHEGQNVPRNNNYYEETIPLYLGDLFIQHFRINRGAVEVLLGVVHNTELISLQDTIPLEKKILFSLWVLAKPESFLAAGDRFAFARSASHNIFRQMIEIYNTLLAQYVVWPQNHGSIQIFQDRSHGFPGVVGVIDGCHVPIKQPTLNANDYYNRKQFHSIILQGICDHRMLFIDIFVGLPGRIHDARVFQNSPIYNGLVDVEAPLLNENQHIIGDSAYPLLINLLTPFRDNGHLTPNQINYNYKLSSIRSVIERAYGRLKGKFRILKYLDIADPTFGTQIISAACVLHNFIILNNDEEEFEDDEGFPHEYNNNFEIGDQNARNRAVIKRSNIVTLLQNN